MMANSLPIFTIGYGNRSIDDFVSLLNENRITFLVDVRTSPYSSYKPEFSQEALATRLYDYDIEYRFLGRELGGRPSSQDCYNEKGEVEYNIIREKSFYKKGIDLL